MPTVVQVTGGRAFDKPADRKFIWLQMDNALAHYGQDIIVVHGGAPGLDTQVDNWCLSRGVHCARVNAIWGKLGRAAGPKRNIAMTWLKPDVCLSFPGGTGTAHMTRICQEAGIPTYLLHL